MSDYTRIRVLSVDDHPLIDDINSQPALQLVAQATSGREAIRKFQEHRPDVTLTNLRLPGRSSRKPEVFKPDGLPARGNAFFPAFTWRMTATRSLEGMLLSK